jgi:hypothetical protein
MISYYTIGLLFIVLALVPAVTYSQTIPGGVAITLENVLDVARSIGGFLFVLGMILAVITIVLSGIMYFVAGSNPQGVKTAKDILKAGLIGSLVIFSVGLIINIIRGFSINPLQFFQ